MKNLSNIEKCIHCDSVLNLNYAYDFVWNYAFAICSCCINNLVLDKESEVILSKEECLKIMVLQ
jgi:hypothetical protein